MSLPGLRGLGVFQVLKCAVEEFDNDRMSTFAAALAYRAVFALFPFAIFLVALLGFLDVPELFDWLRQQAALVVPEQAMGQVNTVLEDLQTPRGGLLSFGILLALWSAAIGVQSAMEALNAAYDAAETRPMWKLYLLSFVYTLAIAALLILAAGLMVIGPQWAAWLAGKVGLQDTFVTLWTWLRWPLIVLIAMLTLSLVYYVAPNVRQRFRFVTPGAVFGMAGWILASLAFGYYVSNFGNYSAMYGSLGAMLVLLFYFFLSAAVLLFGAEINAVVEHEAGEHKAGAGKAEIPETLQAKTQSR